MIETSRLEALLENLARPRVLIVGDLILDRYVLGEVARISPEAPIPVLNARTTELRLGGAGNVAANLRAMEAEVEIVGVIGDDRRGRSLREKLEEIGVDAGGVVIDRTRPTIQKSRLISGVQQMLRVDWEDASAVRGEAIAEILAQLPGAIERAGAVVLSDYGKGVLVNDVIRTVMELAHRANVPVLVDPKGTEYERYSGATLITPNKKEAETAVGRRIEDLDDCRSVATELIGAASLDSIVVTLGADGIYFRSADGIEGRVPAQARAVYDVTGAGDTVVAHLALNLAAGLDLESAIALANHAAGIVVGRLGTNSVTRAELAARLAAGLPNVGKVLGDSTLFSVIESWREDGKRIVFTNGCFDVMHVGHVDYLRFARSKGDVLLVGVNDDASVRRLKGEERPVNPLGDRMAMLAALEMVDAVVSFGEDTPKAIIERVTPDVLVKGEDWKDKGVVGREWVESHGGTVVLAPLVPGRSTTSILEKVRGVPSRSGETD